MDFGDGELVLTDAGIIGGVALKPKYPTSKVDMEKIRTGIEEEYSGEGRVTFKIRNLKEKFHDWMGAVNIHAGSALMISEIRDPGGRGYAEIANLTRQRIQPNQIKLLGVSESLEEAIRKSTSNFDPKFVASTFAPRSGLRGYKSFAGTDYAILHELKGFIGQNYPGNKLLQFNFKRRSTTANEDTDSFHLGTELRVYEGMFRFRSQAVVGIEHDAIHRGRFIENSRIRLTGASPELGSAIIEWHDLRGLPYEFVEERPVRSSTPTPEEFITRYH